MRVTLPLDVLAEHDRNMRRIGHRNGSRGRTTAHQLLDVFRTEDGAGQQKAGRRNADQG
jgi:hypothetical protein